MVSRIAIALGAAALLSLGPVDAATAQDAPADGTPAQDAPAKETPAQPTPTPDPQPAAPAGPEEKVVNLFSWGDYFSPGVLEDFTKATGIKVNYEAYDSQENAEARLSFGGSGHDVVVMSAGLFLGNGIANGVFRKLDITRVPNHTGVDPAVNKYLQTVDPTNDYIAPYLWGTEGIAYNADEIAKRAEGAPVESYALLFSPKWAQKLQKCGIGLIDNPMVVFPMVLQFLGINPNAATADDYAKAADALMKIRPFVKQINSNILVTNLANRTLCIATEWNGDAVQAANLALRARNGTTITYMVPKARGLAFVDGMAIPLDAPHPNSAHAFIDYMLQPRANAQTTKEMGWANAIPASRTLLDPRLAGDARLFPAEDVKARLTLVKAPDPELMAKIDKLWAKVKRGY